MADLTASEPPRRQKWRIDWAWVMIPVIPLMVWLFDPGQVLPVLSFASGALLSTGVFIVFAVLAVGYMKATGAESVLARAFEGNEIRMIFLAALMGGISPFCSCEVIPFIAALLAMGAPLSAVMAFWLSSPLMDPAMFLITTGTLGLSFALAKTAAAVALGLMGGMIVKTLAGSTTFYANPLKQNAVGSGCGCGASPFQGRPVWAFWTEAPRRAVFGKTVIENALFLGKWLALAYLIEALMIKYIPAELIARILGGDGIGPIILGAIVGAPAYLNGYAAVPLIDALLEQGMSNGAAMSFVIAGGVSSIPAAVAVWALVRPRVFVSYLGIALLGAVLAGMGWAMIA